MALDKKDIATIEGIVAAAEKKILTAIRDQNDMLDERVEEAEHYVSYRFSEFYDDVKFELRKTLEKLSEQNRLRPGERPTQKPSVNEKSSVV